MNIEVLARFWSIFNFELKWKRSRAEPKILQFEPARLGLIYLPNIGTNPTYPTTCGDTIVNKYILIILWLTQKNIKGLNYLTSTTLRPDELIEIINEKNQPTAPIGPFPVVWDDMHLIIFIFVKALTYFLLPLANIFINIWFYEGKVVIL